MLVENIHQKTGLSVGYLRKLAASADRRYKVYTIPKLSGGVREIEHPGRGLKVLQRYLAYEIIGYCPVHDNVFSYRKGRGIADLASRHVSDNFLLRIDFRDFFPSITGKDIEKLIWENREAFELRVNRKDLSFVRRIVCRDDRLTIGAPSSPIISNAVLFEGDSVWARISQALGVTYSRYADDLFFSTDRRDVLTEVLSQVRSSLAQIRPKLRINDNKTIFTSKKRKRIVTGLVLTSENRVSLGRQKKRYIRSLIHRFRMDDLREEEKTYLRGYLAFAQSVEPTFVQNVMRKYGEAVHNLLEV